MIEFKKIKLRISNYFFIIFIAVIFIIVYFSGFDACILKILNKEAKNVGINLLITSIPPIIVVLLRFVYKLFNKGPVEISFYIPKVYSRYLSKKKIELSFQLKKTETYKLIRNGIILKGIGKYRETIMPYTSNSRHITISANFKTIRRENKSKCWRYGIDIFSSDNKRLCEFHLDSDNFIVIYEKTKQVLRFQGDNIFRHKFNNLTVMSSIENENSFISCYFNNRFIYQATLPNNSNISFRFKAWSDDKKDHNVKIKNIMLSPK